MQPCGKLCTRSSHRFVISFKLLLPALFQKPLQLQVRRASLQAALVVFAVGVARGADGLSSNGNMSYSSDWTEFLTLGADPPAHPVADFRGRSTSPSCGRFS